jgi:glycosyltransferase involved in cell wall biosynthesis
LETLQPGQTWQQFGFLKCITTSEFQKEYISSIMRNISIDVLTPTISDSFEKSKYPAKPFVAVHSRDPRKTINFIKTFYLKFPQYRWVTFRDMRGLPEKDFASFLKECFLSVWIDETSGFGTFPLESMKCGVPVIGIAPELVPHWMNEDNGVWIKDKILLPELVGDWIQNWLEDNIAPSIYENMEKTVAQLPAKEDFENKVVELFSEYLNHRAESMKNQISKFND